jgi:hypothetical protein
MENTEKLLEYFKTRPEGKDLIFNFFITFARIEFSLKNSRKLLFGNNKGGQPNWDSFINRLNNFNSERTNDIKSAVDYILTHPPQKQVVKNGQIEFIDARVTQSSDLVKLNIYIRRIRNNLFHGGKFQGKYIPDVSRNSILLTSALIIMNEWVNLDSEIKELFCSDILG